MKAIKYLIMGVLLAGFSATANAQVEELNAALSAIKSKAPNAADLAKTAFKKNKKCQPVRTLRQRGIQAQVSVCSRLSVAW